jgi:hypothetical protein
MARSLSPRFSLAKQRASLRAILALLISAVLGSALGAQAAPPAPAAQNQVFLPLVAKAGAPQPDPNPDPGGPTSDELIAAALKAGAIDAEAALLYRVFAAFGDKRLPDAYRGARPTTASRAFDDAARAFAQLKPETQAALRGFAVPPSAEGSWEQQQGVATRAAAANDPNRWATTCQTSANIKVWYHPYFEGDAQKARGICELVDGTIWPKLVELIGHGPLPDGTLPNTGGDARFDIYLVDAMSKVVYPPDMCEQAPTYMLVNRNGHTRSQLAELLMRAILRGHNVASCGEYHWLFWATTTWAMDFVFPTDNAEHLYAPGFLEYPELSLNRELGNPLMVPVWQNVDEGAYLWPFYVARHLGGPDVVGAMWDRSSEPDSLAMINSVIGGGGFRQHWPNFAELNWNRQPVDVYMSDDGLPVGATAAVSEEVRLNGNTSLHYDLPAKVAYLAAEYYHFTFPDESVSSVLFSNPFAPHLGAPSEHAEVQALFHTADGGWFLETWTNKQYAPFCRDLKAERITELTIIVSNSDWQGKKTLEPFQPATLDATNVACRGWTFEAESTFTGTGNRYSETTKTKATGTFELLRDEEGKTRFGYHFEMYRPVGTATWTHTRDHRGCSSSGSGTYALSDLSPDPTPGADLIVETYNLPYTPPYIPGSRKYTALAVAPLHLRPQVPDSCGGMYPVDPIWLQTFEKNFDKAVSADGQTMEDTYSYTFKGNDTLSFTYKWKMTALPPEE